MGPEAARGLGFRNSGGAMDTPLRRSRRLEGLKPESPENPTPVLQARRALVELESHPEEAREPGSPRNVQPPGLGSPRRQSETAPVSPSLQEGAGLGSSQRQPEPGPGSPQRQRDPGLESSQRQPESSPETPGLQSKPNGESPKFSQDQEADSELAGSKAEQTPESPQHQLQLGPGSLEPYPGQQAPDLEPSQPLQELPLQELPLQSPGSPQDQNEPSKPAPSRERGRDVLGPKKRESSSVQAPASKKQKKEEVPVIPKGKPKSGRVWKDRSKKRFSQMVQDKPLRTSWQRKMKERQERKLTKDFARHLEEEKERRRQEKKQRRAENLKRRLENERKAEVVQVIRNPAKLKRAKKKQLRSIEKRDTLAQLQKQPPQRPAAKI